MRAGRLLCILGLVAVFGATVTALAAAAGGVSWGTATKVKGTGSGDSSVSSISCGGSGNCAAVGGFLVNEKAGTWGKAMKLPPPNGVPRDSGFGSVSCASAGNCTAGGFAMVVSEKRGVWGRAVAVRRPAPLKGGFGRVMSVSCASAGNCAVGGWYGAPDGQRAFVLNQVNGAWRKPIEVPGSAALNAGNVSPFGPAVRVTSVSCASAGNCAAGGYYVVGPGISYRAFVVDEKGGKWGNAIEVPGMAALNVGNAQVKSVSCGSAGNCVVVGGSFMAEETGGVWGNAFELQDPASNAYGHSNVESVSCTSAGNCAVGGTYADAPNPGDPAPGYGNTQAFVATEHGGVWGTAIEVPGIAALNVAHIAEVSSVSCASAGNCAAVGSYTDSCFEHCDVQINQVFVVAEQAGVWGNATEVPGTAALNQGGGAPPTSAALVSCSKAGRCAIGGYYTDSSSHAHAFVTAP